MLFVELEEYFKKGRVYVWKETFSVLKSKEVYPDAFLNVVDKNEITVVIEKDKYLEDNIIGFEDGWRIFTFDMLQTFGLTGFLAKLAKILAEDRISIFVVSAYSTAHILVKEEDMEKAKAKLESLGCLVQLKE